MDLPVPYRSGIPIPPGELIFRVAGSPESRGFHYGGKWTLDMFENGLKRVGRTFRDFTDIYDFGCGCGRLTPWLLEAAPEARLYGSDIDDGAVDWLRRNFPAGDFRVNRGVPPLPFRNITFDLVIGYSVFTHLDEEYQDAWLAELHRVTRPGAILLLTVNLDRSWAYSAAHSPDVYEEHMRLLRAQIDAAGILYDKGDDWGEHFPDFYHTTWHTLPYVREHWSRWFAVEAIAEDLTDFEYLFQATIILRRREEASPGLAPSHVGAPAALTAMSGVVAFDRARSTVSWHTSDGADGQIWVRHNDGEETLFAQGPVGTAVADFIVQPGEYTFTLYRGNHAVSPAHLGVPVDATMVRIKAGSSGSE